MFHLILFIYFFNIQQFLTNSDQVLDIVFDTGKPLWLRHSPWLSRFIFWQKYKSDVWTLLGFYIGIIMVIRACQVTQW